MKKFFFLLALGLASISANAQNPTSASTGGAIPAGTISVGGSIGFNTSSNKSEFKISNNNYSDETTNSQFRFSPAVGYFLADNLAVGLNLGYTATSNKVTRTGPGRTSPNALDASTTLRVGPYAQYYKMLSDQFGVLGTLGAGYQSSFTPSYGTNSNNVIETRGNGFYAALTPGVIFFPIPRFGISASIGTLGYDRVSTKRSNDADDATASRSNFGASFGFDQLLFGGTYYFGR
jgi:outer membrane protein W